MPTLARLFAAALLLLACGPEMSAQDQALLDAHNAARAAATPAPSPALPPLQWSEEVTAVARQWANTCNFSHNPQLGGLGENIAAFFPVGSTTAQGVVQGWASEAQSYDYASNSCSGVCGHYTQLVSRRSTAVGCARAVCDASGSPFGNSGNWEFWVCDYDPAGNFNGEKPY